MILGHAERLMAGAWQHPLLEGRANASAAYTLTVTHTSASVRAHLLPEENKREKCTHTKRQSYLGVVILP